MSRNCLWIGACSALALVLACGVARAGSSDVTQAEYDQMKKEVEDLRKQLAATTPVRSSSAVDEALDNKYGPNAKVSTRSGKLTVGGLIQVWFYSIQNDNKGVVDPNGVARNVPGASANPVGFGSNEVADNDSFRIRRAELRFTMDIHENITAYVMIDPAREATSFPSFGSNQGTVAENLPIFVNAGRDSSGGFGHVRNPEVRAGSGLANRSLQDAYINFHGIFPHHDVTVGQFKPKLGEEGPRDSGKLDFIERAMITQVNDLRDLGIEVHGFWWDDRVQYTVGAFDGAGTAFQQRQNRSNTNDSFDLVASILVRPLWKDETWGSLELGYSVRYGKGGEGGGRLAGTSPTDGLNRASTVHAQQNAYAVYKPGGPVRGWWIRGEWGQIRDRFAPLEVVTFPGPGPAFVAPITVLNPAPFNIQGWYVSSGYKLSDSRWADSLNNWVKPMEFTFRFEQMQNIFVADLANPTRHMDVFKTTIVTAGVNYYIKGHNAKLQVNYNFVNEDTDSDNGFRQLREVSNDNLVVNFQVAW